MKLISKHRPTLRRTPNTLLALVEHYFPGPCRVYQEGRFLLYATKYVGRTVVFNEHGRIAAEVSERGRLGGPEEAYVRWAEDRIYQTLQALSKPQRRAARIVRVRRA